MPLSCRIARRLCLSALLTVTLCIVLSPPARGQERLCDSAFEDCRQQLWDLIKNENTEIDVAFWFMQDTSYANLIIARYQAGVKVRIIVDPRANPSYPGNAQILSQFQSAGIPMRYKKADGILHWKMMLFAGQNFVQFSGADYSPTFFVAAQPYQNYIDEAPYFTDDTAVVDSFKTKFDDLWTDTVNYSNYANINGALTRSYPVSGIDPELNFPPDTANGPNDFGYRASSQMDSEHQKIDAEMFRITSTIFSTAAIDAVKRGVPVRLLGSTEEYRNPDRFWDSYNMDLMYMGGVQIEEAKHQGLNHEKAMLLYGQGMTVFGSSNWTGPSENYQQEHNYFTTKPWFFNWFVNQFERKWNSPIEYEPFAPLPPDAPSNLSPSNNSIAQPGSVTLTWEGGYWAHKYDIYFGTSPSPPLIANDVFTGSPGPSTPETFTVSGLTPSTAYYWMIVGKTMANLTAVGPVWSFTTAAATGTSTPTVTSVSPNSGTMNGGTSVTVTGTNFSQGATVSFGNIPATSVSFANSTTITAKAPAHSPGPADMIVVNPDGAVATLASGYTYTGALPVTPTHVSLIAPSSGVPAGGTSVTITGTGFSQSPSVLIGGTPATNVTVTNGVSITATTPAHLAGTVDVQVTNPDGTSSTLSGEYTYAPPPPPPSIASISPSSGNTNGWTAVTITGSGFAYGATVSFGGTLAANIIVLNSTTITAYSPSNSSGAADVTVTNYDGQSATLSGGFTYSGAAPPPTVSSVSPSTGDPAGGTSVTISGAGFVAGATVSFGSALATSVNVVSSTSITTVTPAGSAGAVTVTVTNPDNQSGSLPGGFTYVSSSGETILLFDDFSSGSINTSRWSTNNLFSGTTDPAVATSVVNQQLQIGPLFPSTTGSHYNGLRSTATYNFTGAYCYVELVQAPSSSTAADAMLTLGPDVNNYYRLYVEAGDLICQKKIGGAKTNMFTRPFNPATDQFLRIRNDNNAGTVIFETAPDNGGVPGQWTQLYSEPWNTGSVPLSGVLFEIKAGTWQAEANAPGAVVFDNFKVAIPAPAPSVTAISPGAGPTNGGTAVTISGTGFASGATVRVGGAPAANVTVGSSTSISASTPPNSAGAAGVVVTNPDGQNGTMPGGFTYTASPPPAPSSISPASGSTAGGTSVTLTGSGFASGASVTIGGTAATSVSVISSTSITAVTPAHSSGAVDVVVTNPDGQTGSLAGGYTYNNTAPPPGVSSVSPTSGSVSGGTPVTITGTGLVSGATVTFGGAAATNVSVTSSTTLMALTPANTAGTVSVVVTNPDGQNGTLNSGYTYTSSSGDTVLLADDFSSGTIDSTKWSSNLFSGFTDSSLPMSVVNQQLQIGPLARNSSGSHYSGLRSASSYDFTGAYCYVQLVQAPSSSTAADAMLTIGKDVNDYYRIYVEAGELICQKKVGGGKANRFTGAYDPVNEQYLRIRHDSTTGNVVFETAPDNSGTPGTWAVLYSEPWNTGSIPLSSVLLEIKAGTWQAEANAPGTVVFDNFKAAKP